MDSTELPERRFGWWDMWAAPDDDPRTDGGFHGERETLSGYLRNHRLTLELKCSGLDPAGLAKRSVPPSNLSLLGLLRHLTEVERIWFRNVMAGADAPMLYRTEDDRDRTYDGAVADPDVVAEAWANWRAEVEFAERYVADAPSLDVTSADGRELRGVMVHVLEEYARHNGHADLLRERVDGRIGQ